MDKSAIQNFAVRARKDLIAGVKQRAYQYGITAEGYGEKNAVTVDGRVLSADEQRQRGELVEQIRAKGYAQVMEEAAYTWFNRFIALRFMEVNNYLPSHIRVFSDGSGAFKPEILNNALHLDLPGLDKEKVTEYLENNRTEDLYRYLLLTQCNAFNSSLPRMFEQMGGYTELLLPNNILKQDGVLGHMVADIHEKDWTDQVQIIGWLYQYYNSELKDDTFALLKKNVKITKERIPSATQLFTPDWIVRYMVENSLGRIYVDRQKNEGVYADGRGMDEMTWEETEAKRIANEKEISEQMGWEYYLPEAEQTEEVRQQLDKIQREYANLDVKEIKVIDPCMGSGHILVYAFDVLMQIYEANGYSRRNAAQSILENNLYGLDIDDRAAQLAYFAVMMKARQYDRCIFSRGIQPHVYAIVESNRLDSSTIDYFTNNDPKLKKDFGTLMDELRDAKEYGSILNISPVDFSALYARIDEVCDDISIFREVVLNSILPLIQVAEVMSKKYEVVVTNPPYMGSGSMDAKLGEYVKKNYPDSKSDLFACFIERCGEMTKQKGYTAMITQHAWMFLSSYEKLRGKLLLRDIVSMAHLGARAFEEIGGEVVQTTSFVMQKNRIEGRKAVYCRLVEPTTQQGKEIMFLAGENRFEADQTNFSKIPGSPVAYWVNMLHLDVFDNVIGKILNCKTGLICGKNDKFIRAWQEISFENICFNCTSLEETKKHCQNYFPYNHGGKKVKWYGGHTEVVMLGNNAYAIRKEKNSMLRNADFYFKQGITWNRVGSGVKYAARIALSGFVFDDVSPSGFAPKSEIYNLLAYMNSNVFNYYLRIFGTELKIEIGHIQKVPYIFCNGNKIDSISHENIRISKDNWDTFETSWDFKCDPIVYQAVSGQQSAVSETGSFAEQSANKLNTNRCSLSAKVKIKDSYEEWKAVCEKRFLTLKRNEEELNRIFIEIYGLQDELAPEVPDKDVTVYHVFDSKADIPESMGSSRYALTKQDLIKNFVSYAVGCMFGRYSLDVGGLAFAGGEFSGQWSAVSGQYYEKEVIEYYVNQELSRVNM